MIEVKVPEEFHKPIAKLVTLSGVLNWSEDAPEYVKFEDGCLKFNTLEGVYEFTSDLVAFAGMIYASTKVKKWLFALDVVESARSIRKL